MYHGVTDGLLDVLYDFTALFTFGPKRLEGAFRSATILGLL
jgi:hypothetical protein